MASSAWPGTPITQWSLFLRYQAQAERHYRRAVEEFDRLKALRAELPNEAILDIQPEENEPACTPPDEPIPTPVGQTIVVCGLLPRAFGPRNFMKNRQSDTMAQ
jgi:hypothetical protein